APRSVFDFLEVTVPLVARASVNGVSTTNAKDDVVDRGKLSGRDVSAPSRRSGTIKLSDSCCRSPAAPLVRATNPPRCGSKSTYLSADVPFDGESLFLADSAKCGSPASIAPTSPNGTSTEPSARR